MAWPGTDTASKDFFWQRGFREGAAQVRRGELSSGTADDGLAAVLERIRGSVGFIVGLGAGRHSVKQLWFGVLAGRDRFDHLPGRRLSSKTPRQRRRLRRGSYSVEYFFEQVSDDFVLLDIDVGVPEC